MYLRPSRYIMPDSHELKSSGREGVRKITQNPLTHTQQTTKPSKPSPPHTCTKPTMFHKTNIPHTHTRARHPRTRTTHAPIRTLHTTKHLLYPITTPQRPTIHQSTLPRTQTRTRTHMLPHPVQRSQGQDALLHAQQACPIDTLPRGRKIRWGRVSSSYETTLPPPRHPHHPAREHNLRLLQRFCQLHPRPPNAEDPTNTPNALILTLLLLGTREHASTDACALPLPVNSSLTIPCLP
ncbi:MAG: hypothetical protein KatS3mg019_2291 [Fimbriimonadales bacterium]|nr:MAG: hypothetical protein KatS3mg019_2291 [Fimbriimonadales bacterium]